MPEIDDQIRRAINEGKFDDLPGKGKPLNLDDNPHADPDWRLAHHLLKTSGYTLPWIAARQEIETQVEAARAALAHAWEWRQQRRQSPQLAAQVQAEWGRALRAFEAEVEKINRKIFDYNLQAPSEKLQLLKLQAEKEILRITSNM